MVISLRGVPYWLFGGGPHCWDCILIVAASEGEQEIYGGYFLDTDEPTYCARCECEIGKSDR